jgi:hypothetical protein
MLQEAHLFVARAPTPQIGQPMLLVFEIIA